MARRKLGKAQVEALAELIGELPTGGFKVTITGPRETDRAVLVRVDLRAERHEEVEVYLVGFGGLVSAPGSDWTYPDPKEFWAHG